MFLPQTKAKASILQDTEPHYSVETGAPLVWYLCYRTIREVVHNESHLSVFDSKDAGNGFHFHKFLSTRSILLDAT